jgi:putative hydrolase of the HAD superfamily
MTPYKHILFDLDHTLWDFEKNCSETLRELYVSHDLKSFQKFEVEDFIYQYKIINNRMWKEYNSGKITKEEIRSNRFGLTFLNLGLTVLDLPEKINEDFLRICPTKSNLLPHTHQVLTYLKSRYSLHILTNGFLETQNIKINSSGIENYFNEIVNSESCGFLKPDKKIFDYTLEKIKAVSHHCLMIGDDLEADMIGAKNAGIDHIYFNPKKEKHNEKVTHEISCLSELFNIL